MDETLTSTIYRVKTPTFEGPLELLLNLVESRKLFINEISLASVAEDFIATMRQMPNADLSEVTSFLSVAATLILIKSRSLLPGFLVTKEEEKDIKDLESRLAIYAIIREISVDIEARYGMQVIHTPPERVLFASVFAPDTALTLDTIAQAGQDALNRIPKEEVLPQVKVRKVISIDEMLTNLTERIAASTRISFRQWQNSVKGEDREVVKNNVIVSFLAMLELVRQGMMDALQGTDFDDIELVAIREERASFDAL